MIDIVSFTEVFLTALDSVFGDRVYFVGLQGSYGRGEATDTSNVDTVVILDRLTSEDIRAYNTLLDTLPHRELLCGFISGKREILNWEASDLFQFYYDTKALKGSLDELLSQIDASAVDRAIKTGVCNVYHGCVHNMLYEKSEEILKGLYKSASFTVQAVCFRETGKYVSSLTELREAVSADERAIVDTFIHLKKGGETDFDKMSDALFEWCKKRIVNNNGDDQHKQ